MAPRFDIAPQIAHAAIIELKYLRPGGRKPTKAALAAIKAEAIEQLDKYCADPALAAKWRLMAVEGRRSNASRRPRTLQLFNLSTIQPAQAEGHVHLHRLVLVFEGGDCLLAEEV